MGLGKLAGESHVLDYERRNAVREVIPGFSIKGHVAPKYRAHLLNSYAERDGMPPRRTDNGEYRSVQATRLDRAWQDVAERMDRSEGDIRACVLSIYDDSGEYKDKPARLRHDFDEILEREGDG